MKLILKYVTTLALVTLLLSCGGGELVRSDDDAADERAYAQSLDPSCVQVVMLGDNGSSSESSSDDPISGSNNSGTRPDLRIKSLTPLNAAKQPVTSYHIGEAGYCGIEIENVGNADAGYFQTRCYISKGLKTDSNPNDEGKEDTQELDHGDDKNEYEDFVAPIYPGKYNMMACADSSYEVAESNEKNNCLKEVVFDVWSNPNPAMEDILFAGNIRVFDPGSTIQAEARAKNLGENFGVDIKLAWYVTGGAYGSNEVFLGYDTIKRENLKAGDTKGENLTAPAPTTPGWYTLIARIDSDNRVIETNETDNEIRKLFVVRGPSDDDDDLLQILLNN